MTYVGEWVENAEHYMPVGHKMKANLDDWQHLLLGINTRITVSNSPWLSPLRTMRLLPTKLHTDYIPFWLQTDNIFRWLQPDINQILWVRDVTFIGKLAFPSVIILRMDIRLLWSNKFRSQVLHFEPVQNPSVWSDHNLTAGCDYVPTMRFGVVRCSYVYKPSRAYCIVWALSEMRT